MMDDIGSTQARTAGSGNGNGNGSGQPSGLLIERITSAASLEPHLPSLRRLLQRCVNDDPSTSSIGFLAPLSDEAAVRYWLELLPEICCASAPAASEAATEHNTGTTSTTAAAAAAASGSASRITAPAAAAVLLVATHADVPGVLATVQIALPSRPTHSHRGEVRNLLVHPTYRRHGFGRLVMAEVERLARGELGLVVLTLDTAREAPAREFYGRAGWTEFGVAPDYARWADGRKHACSFFIKVLQTGRGEGGEGDDEGEQRRGAEEDGGEVEEQEEEKADDP